MNLELRPSRAALIEQGPQILSRSDVLAVGVGVKRVGGVETGEPSVKIFVSKKRPLAELSANAVLPRSLSTPSEQVATDVEEMDIAQSPAPATMPAGKTLAADVALGGVGRPRAGGGIACYLGVPGTLACFARLANRSGSSYLLSCNHVLGGFNLNPAGTPAMQPTSYDGGRYPADVVAYLTLSSHLYFGGHGVNFIDAAVAKLSGYPAVENDIDGIGRILGAYSPTDVQPGMIVRKFGRASGLTTGRVVATNALLKVDYWALGAYGRSTIFADQIITTQMCQFGDSGSLLVGPEELALGMLFAGSSTHTYFNPIHRVLGAFDLRLT